MPPLFREVEQKRDSLPRYTVYVKVGLHFFSTGEAIKKYYNCAIWLLQALSSRYNRLFL